MLPISVLITTYRNATELAQCLDSLDWAEDIHVFSRQRSIVLMARGVPWTCPDEHWSGTALAWCLEQGEFLHEWVLLLAANERPSPELLASIEEVTRSPSAPSAWGLRRSLMQQGRHLGTGGSSLDAYPALIRRRAVFASDEHPWAAMADGPQPVLGGTLEVRPLEQGQCAWLAGLESETQEEVRHIVQRHQQRIARDWINVFANGAPFQGELLHAPPPALPGWRLWLKFARARFTEGQLFKARTSMTWASLEFIREHYIWTRVQELHQEASMPLESGARLALVHLNDGTGRDQEGGGEERFRSPLATTSLAPPPASRARA